MMELAVEAEAQRAEGRLAELYVLLDPCPNYLETVMRDGVSEAAEGYGLNCTAVRGQSIPARGRVDFEMRFPIPQDLAPGIGKLSWSISPSGGNGVSVIYVENLILVT